MTQESAVSVSLALEGDKFYEPPTPLGGTHGDVIWSRPLAGVAALKSAAHNELVLYRSDAVDGTPIAVSGIVALPQVPAPDGGYPLISWAHGTLGLGDKCAPSRDSQDMAESLRDHHLVNQAPHVLLNAFLEAGWAVAMSDFEGMGTPGRHPFLLGQSEAHGVLDIALAARRLYPQISNRLAIVGHSQGGQGALFAAHYAPARVPSLALRGVAALAPASHIKDDVLAGSGFHGITGGLAFTPLLLTGAIVGSAGGATAAGTIIDPKQVLSDRAYTLFEESGCRCRVELSRPDSWGGIIWGSEQFRGDLANPNDHQQEFLRQLHLTNPALRITVPIRISHAQRDNRVKIDYSNRLVAELGGLYNDVTYHIYPEVHMYPELGDDAPLLGAHFGVLQTDSPELTAWLRQRLGA